MNLIFEDIKMIKCVKSYMSSMGRRDGIQVMWYFVLLFFKCYPDPNCGIALGILLFLEMLAPPDSSDIDIKGCPVTLSGWYNWKNRCRKIKYFECPVSALPNMRRIYHGWWSKHCWCFCQISSFELCCCSPGSFLVWRINKVIDIERHLLWLLQS